MTGQKQSKQVGNNKEERDLIQTNIIWLVVLVACLFLLNYGISVLFPEKKITSINLPTSQSATRFETFSTNSNSNPSHMRTVTFTLAGTATSDNHSILQIPTMSSLPHKNTPTNVSTTTYSTSSSTTKIPIPTTFIPLPSNTSIFPSSTIPTAISATLQPATTSTTQITISPSTIPPPPTRTRRNIQQCEDTIDNDGDGFTDWPQDPQCKNKNDDDESS